MKDNQTASRNVFTNRNYRLVFFGALVSELGAVLYNFAISFYLLKITGNNAVVQGIYLAVSSVVFLLFTPVGGVLGDRFHKAKIMYLCDYLKGSLILLATLLMFMLPASRAHVTILFFAGIAGGIIAGLFTPSSAALLPHIVEEEQLQQANSYYSAKNALQSIFGVVLAGILYATLPIYTLLLIVGICYILSGVSETFIHYEHKPSDAKMSLSLVFSDMKDGILYLKEQKPIMAFIVCLLFINFFFSPIPVNFLPYFVRTDIAAAPHYLFDQLLTPELWSSVFEMLIGISSLIAALILSARPQEEKCGRRVSIRICATAFLLILLTAAYWIFVSKGVSLNIFLVLMCVSVLLIGFYLTWINVPINSLLMRIVSKDMLSKVSGIISIFSQGLTPIASVLAGFVLQYLGSTQLLVFCSIGFAAAAAYLFFNKHVATL